MDETEGRDARQIWEDAIDSFSRTMDPVAAKVRQQVQDPYNHNTWGHIVLGGASVEEVAQIITNYHNMLRMFDAYGQHHVGCVPRPHLKCQCGFSETKDKVRALMQEELEEYR